MCSSYCIDFVLHHSGFDQIAFELHKGGHIVKVDLSKSNYLSTHVGIPNHSHATRGLRKHATWHGRCLP